MISRWVHRVRSTVALVRELVRQVSAIEKNLAKVSNSLGSLQHQGLLARLDGIGTLSEAEYSVYSQWGEDGIIDFLSNRLGILRPAYLDFGAGDIRGSNGRWLMESMGGAAVFVDARDDLAATLQSSGLGVISDSSVIQTYLDFENASEVYLEGQSRLGGNVDIFSLDIDGQDYWVLESLRALDAKIVIVEYQAYLGHEFALSVPKAKEFDRTSSHFSWIYYGASLPAFIELMTSRGYKLLGTNSQRSNAFFVRNDLVSKYELGELNVPAMKELCLSRGGESRDQSGSLASAHGDQRLILVQGLVWHDCRSGRNATLTELISRTERND